MPSGPGPIPDDDIAHIARAVGGRARTFLLTSRTEPRDIAAQVRAAGTDTVQLVDALDEGALQELRVLFPAVALVQVIHVRGEAALDACAWAPHADALLLDSGNPQAAIRELGGTGRTHDWTISAELVHAVSPCPVWLAGGLRAGNVAEAVRTVRPGGGCLQRGEDLGTAGRGEAGGVHHRAARSAIGPRVVRGPSESRVS